MLYKIIRCMIDQKYSFKEVYNMITKYGYKIIKCPVCGKYTMDSYDICTNCGWEQEPMNDEHTESSSNHMSIDEYRKLYLNR